MCVKSENAQECRGMPRRETEVRGVMAARRDCEVTGLQWDDDVDFEAGQVVFRDTKNNEVKYFPRADPLREMLKRLHETRISGCVFPNRKGERTQGVPLQTRLKGQGFPACECTTCATALSLGALPSLLRARTVAMSI
jgi:hypothetical protein